MDPKDPTPGLAAKLLMLIWLFFVTVSWPMYMLHAVGDQRLTEMHEGGKNSFSTPRLHMMMGFDGTEL